MSKIKAFDFFCGIGGVTRGFLNAGIDVIAGIDIDESCGKTYVENNTRPNGEKVKFYHEKVSTFDISKVKDQVEEDDILVLIGCAPCQPFTTITDTSETRKEERQLLDIFADKVIELDPDYIFVENVSGLQIKKNGNNQVLNNFINKLEEHGLNLKPKVQNAVHFGVPQTRKRLIIFGRKNSSINHPQGSFKKGNKQYLTVEKAIGDLPPIKAGETHPELKQHQSSNLQTKSLKRLEYQTKPGDGMEKWPEYLMLPSRKEREYSGHNDVYARLWWNKPSGTLTTKFHSISNGRFGHPEQNRALSILEGLILQSFPKNYQLFEEAITIRAKQVGNAVPVKLAEAYGAKILEDIRKKEDENAGKF